jgi:hypothetical protein
MEAKSTPKLSYGIKYKFLSEYLHKPDAEQPLFSKLVTTILYLRKKNGYYVDETDTFYKFAHVIDDNLFEKEVPKDKYKHLLEFVIFIAHAYVKEQTDYAEEAKQKIYTKLDMYAKA